MTTLSTSRGRGALAVSTVFTCLATALVLIRIYTRTVMVKQMGADDYAILIALVSAFDSTICESSKSDISAQAFSWAFFGLFVGGLFIQFPRQCMRDLLILNRGLPWNGRAFQTHPSRCL